MPYILNKTNGAVVATIPDGSINKTTDLVFVGKNYAGYGEILNENMMKLLENFANNSAPPKAVVGQLWYDTYNKKLKIFDGTRYQNFPYITLEQDKKQFLNIGDLFYNTTEGKLYVKKSSTEFQLIGPTVTGLTNSSIILSTAIDTDGNTRYVLKHSINGNLVALTSNDEFSLSPDDALYGPFTLVKKGMTLNSTVNGVSSTNGYYYWGSTSHALNADKLGGSDANAYLLKSDYQAATGNGFNVDSDNGVLVGVGGVFRFHANSGRNAGLISAVNGTRIEFNLKYPTINDSLTNVLVINGNQLSPGSVPFDIGSNTNGFRNVYATTYSGNSLSVSTLSATNGTFSSISSGAITSTLRGNVISSYSGVNVIDSTSATPVYTGSVVGSVTSQNITTGAQGSAGTITGQWALVGSSTLQATSIINASSNGFGNRTVSIYSPSGGSDGDIWYKI